MRRYALRCDYCGVFHKFNVEEESVVLEQISGILYSLENDEDVQKLNTLTENEDETGDQSSTEKDQPEEGTASL